MKQSASKMQALVPPCVVANSIVRLSTPQPFSEKQQRKDEIHAFISSAEDDSLRLVGEGSRMDAIDLPSRFWLPLTILKLAGTVHGRTRFQKMVFLSEVEGHIGEHFQFHEDAYGPFSCPLADTLSEARTLGLVDETVASVGYGRTRYDYEISQLGRNAVAAFDLEPYSTIERRVEGVVEKYKDMSLDGLLYYVYQHYLPKRFYESSEPSSEKLKTFSIELAHAQALWKDADRGGIVPIFIRAVVEDLGEMNRNIGRLASDLDSNIILNSGVDMLERISHLFSLLNSIDGLTESDSAHLLESSMGEIVDILVFLEEFASNRNLLTPFMKLEISKLISEKEIDELREDVSKTLREVVDW